VTGLASRTSSDFVISSQKTPPDELVEPDGTWAYWQRRVSRQHSTKSRARLHWANS